MTQTTFDKRWLGLSKREARKLDVRERETRLSAAYDGLLKGTVTSDELHTARELYGYDYLAAARVLAARRMASWPGEKARELARIERKGFERIRPPFLCRIGLHRWEVARLCLGYNAKWRVLRCKRCGEEHDDPTFTY